MAVTEKQVSRDKDKEKEWGGPNIVQEFGEVFQGANNGELTGRKM